MRVVVTMVLACVASAGAAIGAAAWLGQTNLAGPVFGGMMGPLLAASATWIVVVRAHRSNPAGVTGVMMTAFMVKALFFAAYCVAMIKVFGVDVQTFGISFAAFFIALYAAEAALFARLFRGTATGAR